MSEPTAAASAEPASLDVPPGWKIKLLYDGDCPLCLREVRFLRQRDTGQIAFVNIADDSYDPAAHGGISFEAAMGRIHAVLPDGSVLRDLAVFRRVYEILGMGWIYAPTRWPFLRPLADKVYELWAAWRLKLTGRPSLTAILAERENRLCNRSCCGR